MVSNWVCVLSLGLALHASQLLETGGSFHNESTTCRITESAACDDGNACTFDWCDATDGECRNDVIECPRCNLESSSAGRAVEYIVLIADPSYGYDCTANRSKLDAAEASVRELLTNTAKANVSFRIAIISVAQSPRGDDGSNLFLLAGFSRSTSVPMRHFYAEQGSDLGSMPPPGPAGDIDTLARLLSGAGEELHFRYRPRDAVHTGVPRSTGTTGSVSLEEDVLLELRPHTDLHILLFSGLCVVPDGAGDQSGASSTNKLDMVIDSAIKAAAAAARTVSISVFLDGADERRLAAFGDPKSDASYPDGRGFSSAVTLKNLINSGTVQASSLQAYLLSSGVVMRVFGYARSVSRHIYEGIFDPHHSFCSVCSHSTCTASSGCVSLEVECSDGEFCSPVAGCTAETQANEHTPSVPLLKHSDAYNGDVTVTSSLHHKDSESEGSAGGENRTLSDSGANPVNSSETHPPSQESVQQPEEDNLMNKASCVANAEWRKRLDPIPVDVRRWSPEQSFVQDLIDGERPVILRNTVASQWPALKKWTEAFLRQALNTTLLNVKRAHQPVTFDPDKKAAMSSMKSVDLKKPFSVVNMSRSEFFDSIENSTTGHYYFTELPDRLRRDLTDSRLIFASDEDFKLRRHFLWLSSAGMVTHSHFDQDYNFFVQLSGFKTFTLWMPEEHDLMYMYPRLHPMWHKSQVDPASPDSKQHPLFSRTQPYVACLAPGDLLYVPPYAWHHVVSETRSISVSTYSHDKLVRKHMNAIYKHDHKFDLLGSQRGKMFVLRMFLDMMVHNLYGKGRTAKFFDKLLSTRYRGIEKLFPVRRDHPDLCHSEKGRGHMPTAQHVYGYAHFDATVVTKHFIALPDVVRDILFADYVEEITEPIVGVENVYAFFRYCFTEEVEYYLTEEGDAEHDLWEHAIEEDANP